MCYHHALTGDGCVALINILCIKSSFSFAPEKEALENSSLFESSVRGVSASPTGFCICSSSDTLSSDECCKSKPSSPNNSAATHNFCDKNEFMDVFQTGSVCKRLSKATISSATVPECEAVNSTLVSVSGEAIFKALSAKLSSYTTDNSYLFLTAGISPPVWLSRPKTVPSVPELINRLNSFGPMSLAKIPNILRRKRALGNFFKNT
ncbi:hypothetical protein GQX74_007086 [Glossina fuscipes]|nr:hypothetical protein GQX74_007086 [Glossina fuscipes]